MACSKLLANSDRWNDDSVFNRDVLDLAHLLLSKSLLEAAIAKAEQAYGEVIQRDLNKALARLKQQDGWLNRCRESLAIEEPRALLWQKLSNLRRLHHICQRGNAGVWVGGAARTRVGAVEGAQVIWSAWRSCLPWRCRPRQRSAFTAAELQPSGPISTGRSPRP